MFDMLWSRSMKCLKCYDHGHWNVWNAMITVNEVFEMSTAADLQLIVDFQDWGQTTRNWIMGNEIYNEMLWSRSMKCLKCYDHGQWNVFHGFCLMESEIVWIRFFYFKVKRWSTKSRNVPFSIWSSGSLLESEVWNRNEKWNRNQSEV